MPFTCMTECECISGHMTENGCGWTKHAETLVFGKTDYWERWATCY